MENKCNCLIVGSGPAGYTAAIYASRANLSPYLIEGVQVGGQLMTTTKIENFPGYPDGIDPFDLMSNMRQQALNFGTRIIEGEVTSVTEEQLPIHRFKVTVNNSEDYISHTVIWATGASAKYLGIESEEIYKNKGVSACATCDGFFYKGKTVAVVGGGDTACEEASYLAGLCSKVYMIVRKPFLRASQIMQDRVLNNPKIQILFERNTLQLTGQDKVQGAELIYRKGLQDERIEHIDIDGFFLAIGHHPNNDIIKKLVLTNEDGYIITNGNRTNTYSAVNKDEVKGFFAAGDCADPTYRQAIVASASGCKAALDAVNYIKNYNLSSL